MSRRRAAVALGAGYALVAVLVAAGAFDRGDQWSIDHLTEKLGTRSSRPTLLEALVPLLHASWRTTLDVVANVVTLPAQVVISSLLAAACCIVLHRRGRARDALAWALAWVAGNAVEVLCKSTLTKPELHAGGHQIVAFSSSWPSGHTLRSVVLAAIVTAVLPRARAWVAAWAAATLVLLVVAGFHVPSDVLGGVLLAGLLVVLARSS